MNIDRGGRIDLSVVKSVPSTQDRTLSSGDILFNNTNSPDLVGKTALIGERESGFAFSNHMTRIRVGKDLSPAYVAHFLHFLWMSGYMKYRCTNHVNQASISSKTLAQTVPLLIPPASEQARIVEKVEELLSDLDAGVAELKTAQRKLAQYRQSLLKAAMEGALTADWRAARGEPQETGAELLQRILSERRARWEQKQLAKFAEQGKTPPKDWQVKYPEPVAPDLTDLPLLPEGWVWASLGQLCFLDSGEAFKKSEYSSSGVRLLQIANVSFGFTAWDQLNYLPQSYLRSHSDLSLCKDDVVIALNRPIIGGRLKVAKISSNDLPSILYQRVGRLKAISPAKPDFFFMCLESPMSLGQIRQKLQGTDQPYLNTSLVPEVGMPLPPLAEQERIVQLLIDQLDSIAQQQDAISLALKQSAAQRQNILRAAFAGQLVPQDPSDEPAGELLARIRAERASNDGDAPRRRRKTA